MQGRLTSRTLGAHDTSATIRAAAYYAKILVLVLATGISVAAILGLRHRVHEIPTTLLGRTLLLVVEQPFRSYSVILRTLVQPALEESRLNLRNALQKSFLLRLDEFKDMLVQLFAELMTDLAATQSSRCSALLKDLFQRRIL